MLEECGCNFALEVQHRTVKSRGNELVVFLSRQFAEDQTKRQEVMKEEAESLIRRNMKQFKRKEMISGDMASH
jgi:uncharacterized protein YpiB (UPF0302 family)